MACNACGVKGKITDGKEIKRLITDVFEEIAIDGDRWITLYNCKYCKNYWEERYIGGRWDGWPELYKIDANDVLKKWQGKIKIEG